MSEINESNPLIFGATGGEKLALSMCDHLSISPGNARTEKFPDGELIVKVDDDVRGRDCFVVQSTSDPVNSNWMELFIFIDCLRRASADRITAVIPYFGYARQDRKDEGRVPISAKLVANLLYAAGGDRVICMDLHAAQIQGFFDIPVDHLTASKVLIDYFMSKENILNDLTVLSPDVGNVKAANMYADLLNADLAIIDKRRSSETEVISKNLVGDVNNKTILMVDDMISTAGTICEAARVAKENGAKKIFAACTHAVLVGPALDRIKNSCIDQLIITDTIPNNGRLSSISNILVELSVARLLGEAVHRIHQNLSISALFRDGSNS